jgi:predicted RNA-binding protein with PIN domain
MKFKTGEQVIVLNTEHKPVGTAIVKNYHDLSGKYKLSFQYPNAKETEEIDIPEERLMVAPEVNVEIIVATSALAEQRPCIGND